MPLFNNIRKTLNEIKLPSIRRPKTESLYNQFLQGYGWSFLQSDKPSGEFTIYHQAGNNAYVYRCIQAEIDALLGCGFEINNLDEQEINIARTNYLTNVFNHPQGLRDESIFAMLHSQYMRSFELLGDAFIEVDYNKLCV